MEGGELIANARDLNWVLIESRKPNTQTGDETEASGCFCVCLSDEVCVRQLVVLCQRTDKASD